MIATNLQKLTFSMIALALLIGALVVADSSKAADAETAADVFVPGRVYTVTGGKTTLKPTKQVIRKLKRAKVRVRPTGSATGGLRKLVFPVTGGRIGMSEGRLVGRIRHQRSGFRIEEYPWSSGFRTPAIDFTSITDTTGSMGGTVNAIAGYGTEALPNLRLFRLSGIFDTNPEDGTARLRAQARITARGARLLRSKLGLNVKKGITFGIIGVLVAYAVGNEQGGGIYN